MLEMEHYDDFLKQFRTGEIEIVVIIDQTVRGLDFSFLYRDFVPNGGSYQGSGLFAFGGTGWEGGKKGGGGGAGGGRV